MYVLYTIFVLLYFVPCFSWPYKTCLPLLILAVFSAGRSPWQITAALFLSALGDLSGSFKGMASAGEWAFIAQMLFFAIVHLCYICYFCTIGLSRKCGRKKMERHEGLYLGMVLGICMIVLYNALYHVAPCLEHVRECRTGRTLSHNGSLLCLSGCFLHQMPVKIQPVTPGKSVCHCGMLNVAFWFLIV